MTSSKITLTDKHVLLVDDEELVQVFMTDALREMGGIPHTASNGEEALAILAQQPMDLLITDIMMPVMDGLQLLERVKASYPDLQVIVISGYNELGAAVRAMELGAISYLLKFLTCLNSLLWRRYNGLTVVLFSPYPLRCS